MSDESTDRNAASLGLRWVAAVSVSAALLGGVLWLGDPGEVWAVVSEARTLPLAAAVACYTGVLVARWVRLVGLDPRGRLRPELLGVSAGHSLANQLLPARSGELAFPVLWNRATDDGYGRGTIYLAAIRIIELGVVAPIFGGALAAWWAGIDVGFDSVGAGLGCLLAGSALVAGLPVLLRAGLWTGDRLLHSKPLEGIDALASVREEVPRARNAIEELGSGTRLWLVATTLVMWLAMFGVFYWSLVACGAGTGLAQSVVGAGGGILGNLIPVGAVGSFGPMEAGWTAAFRATGAPTSPVVAAGLLVHAIVVIGAAAATGLAAAISDRPVDVDGTRHAVESAK